MKRGALIVIVLTIVALIALRQTVFTIDEPEQAIITQMGEYKRTITEPGLKVKIPLIQTVHRFDKRVLVLDAPPAEYLTLDKKRQVVDSYTRWRIEDPLKFYKTVRTEAVALARMDGIVSSELRKEFATHNFKDIIGVKREPIMESVAQKVGEVVKEFGIKVIDVRIKRADLPPEVQDSVFARMRAERERIAKKYRAEGEEAARGIRAKADKEATIVLADAYKKSRHIIGEGDGKAAKIYAEAYGQDPEFYSFLRSLEAYEKLLKEKGTLVLGTDSKLFRYLEDPGIKK
jgi:membrane protease subunit HflC